MFFMKRNFACSKIEKEFLDKLCVPHISLLLIFPSSSSYFPPNISPLYTLLAEDIVIVNLIVVAYETEFNRILICELKYNSVVNIDSKAPDIMSFWMEFFGSEYGVKRVFSEQRCFLI